MDTEKFEQIMADLKENKIRKLRLGEADNFDELQLPMFVAALKENTSLIELDLKDNNLGHTGAVMIAELLQENKTLWSLNLRNNAIGDDGIVAIANALKNNTTLRSLDISKNVMRAQAATKMVSVLKENATLRSLDIRDSAFLWGTKDETPDVVSATIEALSQNSGLHTFKCSNDYELFCQRMTDGMAHVLSVNRTLVMVETEGRFRHIHDHTKAIISTLQDNLVLREFNRLERKVVTEKEKLGQSLLLVQKQDHFSQEEAEAIGNNSQIILAALDPDPCNNEKAIRCVEATVKRVESEVAPALFAAFGNPKDGPTFQTYEVIAARASVITQAIFHQQKYAPSDKLKAAEYVQECASWIEKLKKQVSKEPEVSWTGQLTGNTNHPGVTKMSLR